jgi:hypothetical protein
LPATLLVGALSGPVASVDPRHEHDLAPVRILVGHPAVRSPVGVLRRRLHTGSRHPGGQAYKNRLIRQLERMRYKVTLELLNPA